MALAVLDKHGSKQFQNYGTKDTGGKKKKKRLWVGEVNSSEMIS